MEGLTYAKHGQKKPLGQLAKINGKRAVAFLDKDKQVKSYTTIDEINDMFCTIDNVPEYNLDF
ncbi:hypothetical protein C807_03938 [Lachnospiraceae bacterium 28-4]|jgi:hypothetical protein|nr:hypothetical protein C807_03938 [Lachnospiraceae bacterium 28-4]